MVAHGVVGGSRKQSDLKTPILQIDGVHPLAMAPLPTDCPTDCSFPNWRWTQHLFGDCVCSAPDAVSFVLGLLSVVAWGIAEIPQIIANFRNSKSEGVSFAFIATWLTGDFLNRVGCVVSPTLPTQLYTAMVYTSTTVVLIAQHLLYAAKSNQEVDHRDEYRSNDDDQHSAPLLEHEHGDGQVPSDVESVVRATTRNPQRARPIRGSNRQRRDSGNVLVSPTGLGSARTFIGGSWGGFSGSATWRARRSDGSRERVMTGMGAGEDGEHAGASVVAGGVQSPNRSPSRRVSEPSNRPGRVLAGSLAAAGTTLGVVVLYTVVQQTNRDLTSSRTDSSIYTGKSSPGVSSLSFGEYYGYSTGSSNGTASASGNARTSGGYKHAPLLPAPPWVGLTLGWLMTLIYLSGRVPQIAMNAKRRSVEGLSVWMFVLAVVGNATYAASILTRSLKWPRIQPNLPWLTDAILCLVMDAVILTQYWVYYGNSGDNKNWDGDAGGDGRFGDRNSGDVNRSDSQNVSGLQVGYVPLLGSDSEEDWEEE